MAGSPIMWRAIFLSASRAISTVSTAVAHLLVQRKKISVFRNDLVLALLDGLRALTSTTCCILWVCAMLHWFCHHLWHRIRLGGLYAAAFCLSAHLLNTVLLGSGRTKRVYTNFEHQKFSGNFNNLESSKVRFYRDFFFFLMTEVLITVTVPCKPQKRTITDRTEVFPGRQLQQGGRKWCDAFSFRKWTLGNGHNGRSALTSEYPSSYRWHDYNFIHHPALILQHFD